MSKSTIWIGLAAFIAGAGADVLIREALAPAAQPPARFVETFEPPLAVGAEPTDPNERIGWIERIVERRLTRALESNPDAKGGPFVDVLAAKLAEFVRRLLGLAVTAAIGLYVWNHVSWVAVFAVTQTALSWLAGRWGSKRN